MDLGKLGRHQIYHRGIPAFALHVPRRPSLTPQSHFLRDSNMSSEKNSPKSQFALVARPEVAQKLKDSYKDLVPEWPQPYQHPIVYHEYYNITVLGLEKLHPFDTCKFRRVLENLLNEGLLTCEDNDLPSDSPRFVEPLAASNEALAEVHEPEYLRQINTTNLKVVQVTEMPALIMVPRLLLQWYLVSPLKYHTGGTMLAAALAIERGWAINLGGGMHHAYSRNGMGWCAFDDIMLAVRRLRAASGGAVQKVLYIDLDAHQGNGVSRDKLTFKDEDFFILDMYNASIFPKDEEAWPAINVNVPLHGGVADAEYLGALQGALARTEREFPSPDLVFYNAGTDILDSDPLGRMCVSAEGVTVRDHMVWDYALKVAQVPLVMALSGGYARGNADVISSSLSSLIRTYRLTS